MNSAEVRRTFLEYFGSQGHKIRPSSPSIPFDDPTIMFTNAGMVQFKDIFTGRKEREEPCATTCQKCVRAGGKHNDLDNVGYTTRHLTFFEMLGNFSFGDYFKEQAIYYAWELISKHYGLKPDRLWATVYQDDDEAFDLWKKISTLPEDRIVRLGEKDNFWSMGDVGPCGPCSEILLDRGEKFGEADVENGERFFEIWNLVFMQYNQAADGSRTVLPKPSIDTGMGLERMAMVMQDVDTVFDTDLLRGLIARIEDLTGVKYDPGPDGVSHRVLADHVRSLVFTLADGGEITNEGRGYVLRRILRGAARYGRNLLKDETLIHNLVDTLVDGMGEAYPEIADPQKKEFVTKLIVSEENSFGKTLDRGIELFNKEANRMASAGEKTFSGDQAFLLYDSYGFPLDLTERMSEERGYVVDVERFDELMKEQQEKSRTKKGIVLTVEDYPETTFSGYESTSSEAELQAAVEDGETWNVILSQTPFYGESGGQVGDTGVIQGDGFKLQVSDTTKESGRFVHVCKLLEGDASEIKSGDGVNASVDIVRRHAIQRNHTATHLVHAALREVVGDHVHQKGSVVDPDRLRFDVTHFDPITPDELRAAEDLVFEQVLANTPVEISEMPKDDAIAMGAMAFFGDKYGDVVRVVKIGGFSIELCGGTHVERTGDIGPFALVKEGSVSAGVRRVEALTASQAEGLHRGNSRLVESLAQALKVSPDRLVERVTKLLDENRKLKQAGKKAAPAASGGNVEKHQIGDILLITGLYDGVNGGALRDLYDGFKKESDKLIATLISKADGKVNCLVGVSRALTKDGWKAGDVFQAGAEHIAARGGGRPEMVQAGGKSPDGAEEARAAMKERVEAGK